MKNEKYHIGIDIGSTAIKLIVWDNISKEVKFQTYRRHNFQIIPTLYDLLGLVVSKLGEMSASICFSGSIGMGLSEKLDFPFLQEVVASSSALKTFYPQVKLLIDIGGEDSKIILMEDGGHCDFRMNGSCAGGTGAFIDQLGPLLDIPLEAFDEIARRYDTIYPISGRCGVFAKSDVQNLLSKNISKANIMASVFEAMVVQTFNTLLRGYSISPKVLLTGGPFTFIPFLREVFFKHLALEKDQMQTTTWGPYLPAIGSALHCSQNSSEVTISLLELQKLLKQKAFKGSIGPKKGTPLFSDLKSFREWEKSRFKKVSKWPLEHLTDKEELFLGIDCGSTTTKLILINREGQIVLEYYIFNKGDHLQSVYDGLEYFKDQLAQYDLKLNIARSAVTGYGEDLIAAYYAVDEGLVEPLAHFRASQMVVSDPSFILDIGGQDMKAIFIENSSIKRIEINEACSSGCGSFISTLAQSLGYSLEDFGHLASLAHAPCKMGSRCTIFMNSLVKQHLREGEGLDNIAAGLCYSMAQNSLEKVLKIKDVSLLGKNIVLQGGTFKNAAIHRAFELVLGTKVICPQMCGLMGAYGAALKAMDTFCKTSDSNHKESTFLVNLGPPSKHLIKKIICSGCENNCQISKTTFREGTVFYSGNRCDKFFSNGKVYKNSTKNLSKIKLELLFNRNMRPNISLESAVRTIGIPRALNLYENFPFWCTLFTNLGFEIVLSSPSSNHLFQKGVGTITSDNICFPVKLLNGHIIDLIEKGVDRIFYPSVKFEKDEFRAQNSFNCPIVTGGPDIIESSVGIHLDRPSISFKNYSLLKKKCYKYFKQFNIAYFSFERAFKAAIDEQNRFKQQIQEEGAKIMARNKEKGKKVILLVGHPYHLDPLINYQIPQIIQGLGYEILLEDSIPEQTELAQDDRLTNWAYINRIYNAALFASKNDFVEFLQINSFGCGPDSIAIDEVKTILDKSGKNQTVIRVDETVGPDSIKLRIRSLIESFKSFKEQGPKITTTTKHSPPLPPLSNQKKKKVMLIPFFSHFHSPLIPPIFRHFGVETFITPPSDKRSQELGMKYTNNEICYPAILVVGDILKELLSGKYDLNNIIVGISQTGGQCRLSSYRDLILKALKAAGFAHIPVLPITFSIDGSGHTAFNNAILSINKGKLYDYFYKALLFGDSLANMYYSTLPREIVPGSSWKILQKYIAKGQKYPPEDNILNLINEAVNDFNNLPLDLSLKCPTVGIVGEIYVKYSPWANLNAFDWLAKKGINVVMPSLSYVLPQMVVNRHINQKEMLLEKDLLFTFLYPMLRLKNDLLVKKLNNQLKNFKFYRPIYTLEKDLKTVEKIVSTTNQYGEGWMLTAEVLNYVRENIFQVLCLQPFGCIANQVVAKGIEKKLRDHHPKLNILYLDVDFDTSEANFFNRLHVLVDNLITDRPFKMAS